MKRKTKPDPNSLLGQPLRGRGPTTRAACSGRPARARGADSAGPQARGRKDRGKEWWPEFVAGSGFGEAKCTVMFPTSIRI
jgi:hypothetical protein